MGFRKDAYATVWEITPVSNTFVKGRISTSRKNKDTGEYETDFSGFVEFVGTACANNAIKLKERDRIRIGDVDVTTVYNKEKKVTYTNFKIFNFENVTQNRVNASKEPASNPEEGLNGDNFEAVMEDSPF